MEEYVIHQECVIVLIIGVEATVLYVCTLLSALHTILIWICFYTAVCPAGCFNGGNCSAPGICTCSSGWTGNECRQGMKYNPTLELYGSN